MKFRPLVLCALVAVASVGLLAATPWQQDAKAKEKAAGSGDKSTPFTEAEMAAWQKSMTPGPQHKDLARLAGTWAVHCKSWMKPGEPAEEWTGTAECKAMLGGRYLVEDFSGTMSMGPYHGHGMLGFNNTTGQWEQVWLDDMSTGMMVAQGESKDGATTLHSTVTCPLNGQRVSMRTVMRSISDNERTVEMWSTFPGQQEFQSMLLHYERPGSATKSPNSH